VTGRDSWWHNLKIRAKYAVMRLRGILYPDVYCIPFWINARCHFLANGARIAANHYDFIFSELNAGEGQLQYLADIIKSYSGKTVVLPGPPEIFLSYSNEPARRLARQVLREAGHVWAYSEKIADFADSLAGAKVSRLIPWPFDYATTFRVGQKRVADSHGIFRVLIGAPLRFGGIAENAPRFLEECLIHALEEIPHSDRRRFRFHAFVFTDEDRSLWYKTQFGKQIGAVLEHRRSYTKFLRFVGTCDAVIQLSRFGVLGRMTFIAAALGKPGIFTDNVELNQRLYPNSLLRGPSDERLQGLVRDLVLGLLGLRPVDRFVPDTHATEEAGNFKGNAEKVRAYLYTS
jgi:hypothetical protein